jgi:uncharacterized protein YjbI with pentapeptide repeats
MSPKISQDPMYQLIRDENVEQFNKEKSEGKVCDLTECDFKGFDLRNLDVSGLDFTDAYFRGADLRSLDFRGCKLAGASLADAKISGCFFPSDLTADEILMSVQYGTRLRQPTNR